MKEIKEIIEILKNSNAVTYEPNARLLDVKGLKEKLYVSECDGHVIIDYGKFAESFYNAGYRKRSEGEWVCDSMVIRYSETLINEHCSNCGRKVTRTDKQPQVNYCPNCGAKMKGVEK